MAGVHYIEVTGDEDGQRLDRILKSRYPDQPFGLLQKLLRTGQIRVDSKRAKTSTRVEKGQQIRIPPMAHKPKDQKPRLSDKDREFMRSLVLYDDGQIIAINKPHDLAVQGGTSTERHIDGMLDALIDPKDPEATRPRLVHRLDKETSGIMLLARNAQLARDLGKLFKGKAIRKIYWTLLSPAPEVPDGIINAPLHKASAGPGKERVFVDEEEGKPAVTEYQTIDKAGDRAAFVAFWPKTGRTHQIRAHAELLDCPIIGEHKYNLIEGEGMEHIKGRADLKDLGMAGRLHLHAHRLTFTHPRSKQRLDLTAPLPQDLADSWKALGFDANYDDSELFEE